MPNLPDLLSETEMETLALMLGYGMPEGFSKGDFAAVVKWAGEARMNAGILEAVLDASMCLCVTKGCVAFKNTAKGNRHIEQLIKGMGGS